MGGSMGQGRAGGGGASRIEGVPLSAGYCVATGEGDRVHGRTSSSNFCCRCEGSRTKALKCTGGTIGVASSIAEKLGLSRRQQANSRCRELERGGIVERRRS